MLNESGQLKWLCKPKKKIDYSAISAYNAIYDHYFKVFGTPKQYKTHLANVKSYCLKMCKYLKSGGSQRHLLTHIDIDKGSLASRPDVAYAWQKEWAHVIKGMGHTPNIKTMSTFDFLSQKDILNNG